MKISKPKLSKSLLLNVLLYYSTFLSTILIIGGFWTARSEKEIISNFLFLPIVVFLWIIFIQKNKRSGKDKNQKIKNKL
ncbi:MAG: hypothetical protein U9R00_02200 [Patescibacteria group bacterium]|nr:hypothetical protein [Patescibacteria group bacterium]